MKQRLISLFLAFSMLCSLCTTAFALEAPATPTGGVSIFVDDVRVEAKDTDNPVDFKIVLSYDPTAWDMGRTAKFQLSVPAATTGISETSKAQLKNYTGVGRAYFVQTAQNFENSGTGDMSMMQGSATTFNLTVTVPNVTATSKISLTPVSGEFYARKGATANQQIPDNKVTAKTGSIILQYPVTVTMEGTVPTGASATVKTTEYDTGKATYDANGATTTTLTDNSTLWVDSGAGQQNIPALDLTAPAGYKAEVKVGSGDWQLAGKNFSIGEVKAATTVSIRYTQTTADTVTISVTDKYGAYQLGTWAQNGEKHATNKATVSAKPYTGYTAYAYILNGNAQVDLNGATSVEVPLTGDQAITFLYKRTDGSAVVPGKDGTIGSDDDVTVTPNDKNDETKNPTVDDATGKVTVPDDTTATVTRPKDPDKPADGKEDVIVPGGTTIDKDGTIHLPKKPDGSDGGTINPGDKLPENAPKGTVIVTYKANGGTGKDVLQVGDGSVKALGQQHTAPANKGFESWNTQEFGNGDKYNEGDEITASTPLFAQWSNSPYNEKVEITFNSNLNGVAAEKQTIGFYNGTSSTENLRKNSFAYSGWSFGGWSEAQIGEIKYADGASYTFKHGDAATLDLYAQWYKQSGSSITVPGKDGDPSNADTNVTGAGNGISRDATTGVITIPNGGTITVTKNGQQETITLPNGGILNPDGSYTINLPNGDGKIDVDKDGNEKPKDDDGTDKPNAKVVTLTYEINNGEDDAILVKALEGVETTAIANPFTYSGHVFLNWMANINGTVTEIAAETGTFTPQNDMTIYAQWAKQDSSNGSIELPGKDGILDGTDPDTGTDHAKDNVTVTPDEGGKVTPQPDGSVKVEDKDGTVTRPDPENPDKKEDIKVPEGSVVEPDGTIKLPDGTEIGPDQKFPEDVQPQNYVVITYEPNGGTGDTVKQVVKTNEQTNALAGDTFTAPSNHIFEKWVNADDENDTYEANGAITPSANLTLKAKWQEKNPDPSVYTVTITYHSGSDTSKQRETGSSKQFSATLNANTFTAPETGWTFMGWTTDATGGKNGTFYKDGGTIALDVTAADPDLYAVWYHADNADNTITLPGQDLDPTTANDNITVAPGTGNAPTVKNDSSEGYVEAGAGNTITQPSGTITVEEGTVKVYPDGTIYVPAGSKVKDKDNNDVPGPSTIDPDGTNHPDTKDDPKKDPTDNSIIIPGKDGFIDAPYDDDNLIVKPDADGNATGSIDNGTGDTTITNPDGADVSIPGANPPDTRADIKLPQGTVIKPDGTIILPDDKNGQDENGGTLPGGSTIDKDGVVTYKYTVVYLDSSNKALRAPTFLKLKAGESDTVKAPAITGYTVSGSDSKTVTAKAGDTYTVTFIYTKDSGGTSGGGGSSGGGGGGSSVSSSFTIKASAGANGSISPNGSVSVARGKDQTFTISAINGYRIADVLVDGKSVGNVSTYTFENVKANHTIEAKFVKQSSIVADPTETGVAGWLQTSEHIAYLSGYGNGNFGPTDNMTRAQAAQMFYNLLLNKNVDITVKFTDVPADAWYGNAVHTLASLGIIKGIGNDQFAPNRTITRAEFAVIAMRFANLSATVTNPFTDIASNDWYYSAVTSAVSYGWINGYNDGTFRPYATITRAEVATIVNRMLNRTADRDFVDGSAVTHFDDVPNTYWAYYSIAEATNAHTHTIDNDGVESWGRLK